MTPRTRRILGLAALGLLVAAGFAYAFRPQPIPVDVAAVVRGPMMTSIDDEGRTRVRELYVVSAPTAGRLLRIHVHAGDAVKAGETLLATIRPAAPTLLDVRARAEAQAAVDAAAAALTLAEANVRKAEAELGFAQSDLERTQRLAERQAVATRELERAEVEARLREAALASARADVLVRQAELERARAALIEPSDASADGEACCIEVVSAVDGHVLQVLRESEGVVAAGTSLLEIGDLDELEVVVEMMSADAVRIEEGASVLVEGWGGDEPLAGRVRRIEPFAFPRVSALGIEERRVNVIVDLIEPPEGRPSLGHGFKVDVRVVSWRDDDVVQAPLGALFRDGAQWAAFVVTDEGVAERREVEVGHMNDRVAQILSGLSPGERIVEHPSDRIADRTPVEPRRDARALAE